MRSGHTPTAISSWPNPFATRFVQPGRIEYRLADNAGQTVEDACDVTTTEILANPSHLDPVPVEGPSREPEHMRASWRDELVRETVCNRFSAIVGPHGTGKSTLLRTLLPTLQHAFPAVRLLQLQAREPASGWGQVLEHVRRSGKQVRSQQRSLASHGLLIVDGYEQLFTADAIRLKRSICRRGQHLLVTCHRPPGAMKVIHRTVFDWPRTVALTRQLVSNHPIAVQRFVENELSRTDGNTLTNLRDFWFQLYDAIEQHRPILTKRMAEIDFAGHHSAHPSMATQRSRPVESRWPK